MAVLDTKRENADEKVRIKTLSIGVVVPDILYEVAEKNEALYLFSPYDVKRLYGVPLSMINVTKKYHELVANKGIRKKKVNARKLMEAIGKINGESGYPYVMNEDVVNAANPIDGYVRMSNLCVAPETNILTDKGDVPIVTKVDQEVNVWNGEEWSKVTVRKTGENQKLLTVKTSDGRDLDCTEYHKWYKQEGYGRQAIITEVRTIDLEPGDKLIKWTPPIIEGKEEFAYPYLHGFISADGTMLKDDKARIYLYNKKLPLVQSFGLELKWRQGSNNRLEAETIVKYPKYTVPTAEYTIKSRLDWLAGWLDGDGSVYRNGDNEALVGSSSNEVFIKEIQSLLLTLGVNAKISTVKEADFYKLPLNDGSGNYSDYYCKKHYRILINSDDTQNLLNLGLILKRLVVKKRDIQRKAAQFVVVVDVQDNGRYSDTYCFTEPKRHMGVFNGILTGNCSEILQVQTDSEMNEDGSYKVVGKDVSCNLGSLNVFKTFHSPNFSKTIEVACRALTKVSDLSNIACVPSIDNGNKISHAIGLGAMNLHGFFGHHRIMYGSPASIDFTDLFFMTVNYHSILSSCKIAQEKKQTFEGFEKSDYASGVYFDQYLNRDLTPQTEQIRKLFAEYGFEVPTKQMWEALRDLVMVHGLYNQYRMAIPPTGSISYVNNSTASIHPIAAKIEIRKEGKTGRSYYPAPHMTNDNLEFFVDAYELGYKAVIDVYAAATPHVDQGLSLTIFLPDNVSTRDINKMQIYARSKGIKTIYYVRLRKSILSGTEVEGCVSCAV